MAGNSWGSGGWTMKVTGLNAVQNLFEQIAVDFDGSTAYVVGPQVTYAVHNERGTENMAARPFMRPAAEEVSGNTESWARRISSSQGIPLDSEENIVKCIALAVESEAKRIADAKGVRDTGDLIASIEARPA